MSSNWFIFRGIFFAQNIINFVFAFFCLFSGFFFLSLDLVSIEKFLRQQVQSQSNSIFVREFFNFCVKFLNKTEDTGTLIITLVFIYSLYFSIKTSLGFIGHFMIHSDAYRAWNLLNLIEIFISVFKLLEIVFFGNFCCIFSSFLITNLLIHIISFINCDKILSTLYQIEQE